MALQEGRSHKMKNRKIRDDDGVDIRYVCAVILFVAILVFLAVVAYKLDNAVAKIDSVIEKHGKGGEMVGYTAKEVMMALNGIGNAHWVFILSQPEPDIDSDIIRLEKIIELQDKILLDLKSGVDCSADETFLEINSERVKVSELNLGW
jgi:hypothetical protein